MTDFQQQASGTGITPFDPVGVSWQRVSSRLTVVRMVAAGLLLGVPAVALVLVASLIPAPWVWLPAAVLLLGLAWACWLIPRQVAAVGYTERGEDLLVRRGVMFRRLVVVPYGRMQLVDVNAGPIARGLGIASLQLHTASASTDATVPGIPAAAAAELRDRLAARGESRMAGL